MDGPARREDGAKRRNGHHVERVTHGPDERAGDRRPELEGERDRTDELAKGIVRRYLCIRGEVLPNVPKSCRESSYFSSHPLVY